MRYRVVQKSGGERRIRTTEGISQQIYSLPRLTASVSPHAIQYQSTNYTGIAERSQAQKSSLNRLIGSVHGRWNDLNPIDNGEAMWYVPRDLSQYFC
jgi:hypothetical protein